MRVLLAAGGTGGHLFPAQALAAVLERRGSSSLLITDRRAKTLVADFRADEIRFITADTLRGRDPMSVVRMGLANVAGLTRSLQAIRAFRPSVAVGFGGYPTLPPLMAAWLLKVPAIVHEANAVLGRANRSLASRAHVATAFPDVRGIPAGASVTRVGIPVRQAVLDAVRPYVPAAERFNLLVFGGSQGARAFADLVPPAVATLSEAHRARLTLVQQCRTEDMARVTEAYADLGLAPELAPFFADLPKRMADAHLVIARAGASTIAELSIIGRPSLMVPLPGAIDQDQSHNAAAMEALGGGKRLDQSELTPARLGAEIAAAMDDPAAMAAAAEKAKGLAKPDAAERLADLCEQLATGAGR